MHNSEKSGNCKANKTPFLRLFTGDWIVGTMGLTFEQKGFYLEVLLRMWERKGGLPNDDKWLAAALQCNPRTVRKLKGELIALQKLIVNGNQIVNPRIMREIGSPPIEPELEPNSARIEPELEPNAPEKPTITTRAGACALHFHIQTPEREEREERIEREESVSSAPPLGFSGRFIQFSEEVLAELKADYPRLDFPADLKTADAFLACVPTSDGPDKRMVRLRQYLAKRNGSRGQWSKKSEAKSGGLRAVLERHKSEARVS